MFGNKPTEKRPTRGMSVAERLDFYGMPVTESGCWIWMGCIGSNGYGNMTVKGEALSVHRLSWETHKGVIPEGMCVCHKCDTPLCINPEHLFLGTPLDNNRDAVNKGRLDNVGEGHPRAKLSESQVIEIFNDPNGISAIAHKYGMGDTSISNIKNGRSWMHLNLKGIK